MDIADTARNDAILRYRIAVERGIAHQDEIGRCSRIEDPGARKFEYDRLRERGKQLAEDEACCRDQYEKLGCEQVTKLSPDAFEAGVAAECEKRRKLAELREHSLESSNHL